jgi:perosamine synthetase
MIPPYKVATGPFRKQILREFQEVLESGMFILGDKTDEFEKTFAASHYRKHGVAVNSDTAALEAALLMLNRKNFSMSSLVGKVVLMPDTAFFGCANVVARFGGMVLPVPVSIENGIMPTLEQLQTTVKWFRDISALEIMAYMCVYTAGTVGKDAIACIQWCKEQGIPVIEDAAHCHGATYTDGLLVGHHGDIATYSFYATKMIHSGEGGMLLVDDDEQAEWLRTYRNYGKVWGPGSDPVFADCSMVGYNWRMTEFQAALGRILWEHYQEIYDARRIVEKMYDEFFHPDVFPKEVERLLVQEGGLSPNLYRYIVLVNGLTTVEQNHKLYALLKEKGIILQAKCNSKPLTEHTYLAGHLLPTPHAILAPYEASRYCMQHLCLPIYPSLMAKEAQYIAATVTQVVEEGAWK